MSNTFHKFSKKVFAVVLSATMMPFTGMNKVVNAQYDKYPDKNVFALKEDLLPSWGIVSSTNGSDIQGQNPSNQKVSFGRNPSTGKQMSWWVAARVLMDGRVSSDPGSSSHMILYPNQSVSVKPFNEDEIDSVPFEKLKENYKQEFEYVSEHNKKVNMNHYGISDCRRSLKTFLANSFSKGEKSVMKDSKVKVFDNENKVEYTVEDKLYLPSANKKLGIISWSSEDIVNCEDISSVNQKSIIPFDYLMNNLPNDNRDIWTRSVDTTKKSSVWVAMPFNETKIHSQRVIYNFELMPVAKLSVEDLLFASSASSVDVDDKCTVNGKFSKVNKDSPDYGMSLKFSANGSDLTDAFVAVDKDNSARVHYGNVPKDSYLTVCAAEREDWTKSYTTSIPLNSDGTNPDGVVDLDKLDSGDIGSGKDLVVQVWVERQRDDGLLVATAPRSTSFKTQDSICIEDITDKVYDGQDKVVDDLVVRLGETVLENQVNFSVEYFYNKNVGTALVVVKGKGEYEGYISSKTFSITPALPIITLQNKVVAFDGDPKLIDEAIITGVSSDDVPTAKVVYKYFKDSQCKQKLCSYTLPNKNFKIPAKAPTDLGVYYVKVVMAADGNYSDAESNLAEIVIKESL